LAQTVDVRVESPADRGALALQELPVVQLIVRTDVPMIVADSNTLTRGERGRGNVERRSWMLRERTPAPSRAG
jgi:hypothetical protein